MSVLVLLHDGQRADLYYPGLFLRPECLNFCSTLVIVGEGFEGVLPSLFPIVGFRIFSLRNGTDFFFKKFIGRFFIFEEGFWAKKAGKSIMRRLAYRSIGGMHGLMR